MILTIIVIVVMVIATIAVEKCKGPALDAIIIIIIITSAMKNQVDVFELI